MFEILIAGTFGYLTGSIFLSYYWGKLNRIDLTQEGTGQLGASNAGRTFGWPIMVIVGISDILKATIALAILTFVFNDFIGSQYYDGILIVGSLGIVFGHVNSFWIWLEKHNWHGGKGGSSLGGILLFLSLESFLILFIGLMLTLKILKRYLLNGNWYENFSTNAIVVLFSPFVILWFTGNSTYFVLVLLIIGTILFFERAKISSILGNVLPKEAKKVWDQ
ncbi:MAG: glycerol-3-phosphate acyltransferase [Candidatus Thorarchaeota archaeon]